MSWKRRRKKRACTSKVRHGTEAEAWAAMAYLRNDPRYDGQRLSVYRCRYCAGFHFGHPPNE